MSAPTQQAKFLNGSLTQHIISMSLTAAMGFIALFMVDLADMLFISMLGIEALAAAVGYAGSILFMTTAISIGMAIAGGALVPKSLGESQPERAKELFELRACSRTVGCFTPVHERGTKWDNIEEHTQTSLRQARLIGFMNLEQLKAA